MLAKISFRWHLLLAIFCPLTPSPCTHLPLLYVTSLRKYNLSYYNSVKDFFNSLTNIRQKSSSYLNFLWSALAFIESDVCIAFIVCIYSYFLPHRISYYISISHCKYSHVVSYLDLRLWCYKEYFSYGCFLVQCVHTSVGMYLKMEILEHTQKISPNDLKGIMSIMSIYTLTSICEFLLLRIIVITGYHQFFHLGMLVCSRLSLWFLQNWNSPTYILC